MSEIELIKSLNAYVGLSTNFDNAMVYLADFYPLKMLPSVIILCWFWFSKKTSNCTKNREIIIKGVVGSFLAMFVARILSKILPFRLRPLHDSGLLLNIPDSLPSWALTGWSSMPSDNATLGFALATIILLIHFEWGIFAFLQVLFLVCFPRVYLSLHYPTDIIIGGILGMVVVYATIKMNLLNPIINKVLSFKNNYPKSFYIVAAALFIELIMMFKISRACIRYMLIYFNIDL